MYLSICYAYAYYKGNPKNDIRMFSHKKSMYIKVIKIIVTAIVSPENGRQSCRIDFASISPIFLFEFTIDLTLKKLIHFGFFVCVFGFSFCISCFVFSFVYLLVYFCFLFGNSYDLEIIFTCSDLKLMIVCNLVYIVNISCYDASHLMNCWKERLRSVVGRWSITSNNCSQIRSSRHFTRP